MSWKMHATCLMLVFFAAHLPAAEEAGKPESIAYRLPKDKTIEYDDSQKADQHLKAVQKLGCEATIGKHDGHSDVTYKCPKWKSMTVANDKLVHQWESWLKKAGFETLHGHEADDEHDKHHDEKDGDHKHEEVNYRVADWKTIHTEDGKEDAQELVAMAKALGCEVKEDRNDGHADVSIRCPEWRHIEVESHKAAEVWEKWLKAKGFETKHAD